MAATTDIWKHIITRTEVIPDDCHWDDLSDAQQTIVLDTISVEREWIVDHADWKENTMFDLDDDEDE